jgi:putative transposase
VATMSGSADSLAPKLTPRSRWRRKYSSILRRAVAPTAHAGSNTCWLRRAYKSAAAASGASWPRRASAAKTRRKFKAPTAAGQAQTVAPNQLNREFMVQKPDTVYVGDMTYLPTGEGWLYLAVVLDLCSRAVVGWSMADHMRAELVNQALSMALCQRQPAAGRLVHTDRGSQYGADSYRQLLAQHGIEPSMSRKGNCWDNAVAESFFHTLKTELIYPEDFDTHEQVQIAVFEYIEVFYNRQRCHSANGYLAPLAYEQALKTHGIFCPEKC